MTELLPLHQIVNNCSFTYAATEPPYLVVGCMGAVGLPLATHLATPVAEINGYSVEATLTGPVCGECTDGWREVHGVGQVRHASVDHIRCCAEINDHIRWQAECEAPLIRMGVL